MLSPTSSTPEYVPTQIAEWSRQTLDISIEPEKLHTDDLADLQRQIRHEARAETKLIIDVTLGEYMSNDLPPQEWDLRGLSQWAMSRFKVDLKQNQLRQMNIDQVSAKLIEAANEQIDKKDLAGVAKFLDAHHAQKDLAEWAKVKFGIELDPAQLADLANKPQPDAVTREILDQARQAYQDREVTYPVEFMIEMVYQAAQQDGPWAAEQLSAWANQRYEMGWTAEDVAKTPMRDLLDKLMTASRQWMREGKLETLVNGAVLRHLNHDKLAQWARERFSEPIEPQELEPLDEDGRKALLLKKGQAMLRSELTQLERFVLLQILDAAWKDHLYAMDQLKDSVGLRGYAEKDPRIEYKREGSNQFIQMQRIVRDRVTDLIFRAKLTPNIQQRNVYHDQHTRHDAPASTGVQAAAPGTDGPTRRPRRRPTRRLR